MSRLRLAAAVVALSMAGLGGAVACDDHHGACQIEDWNYSYIDMMQAIQIDGVVTCDAGQIRMRLYDGEGGAAKFIGVERAYIRGHTFQAMKLPVARPSALSIRYSIEPE